MQSSCPAASMNSKPQTLDLTLAADVIAENLNQMQWRRVDVDFSTAALSFLAHNLIQVRARKKNTHRTPCSPCTPQLTMHS